MLNARNDANGSGGRIPCATTLLDPCCTVWPGCKNPDIREFAPRITPSPLIAETTLERAGSPNWTLAPRTSAPLAFKICPRVASTVVAAPTCRPLFAYRGVSNRLCPRGKVNGTAMLRASFVELSRSRASSFSELQPTAAPSSTRAAETRRREPFTIYLPERENVHELAPFQRELEGEFWSHDGVLMRRHGTATRCEPPAETQSRSTRIVHTTMRRHEEPLASSFRSKRTVRFATSLPPPDCSPVRARPLSEAGYDKTDLDRFTTSIIARHDIRGVVTFRSHTTTRGEASRERGGAQEDIACGEDSARTVSPERACLLAIGRAGARQERRSAWLGERTRAADRQRDGGA